jgi:hypothetical protein
MGHAGSHVRGMHIAFCPSTRDYEVTWAVGCNIRRAGAMSTVRAALLLLAVAAGNAVVECPWWVAQDGVAAVVCELTCNVGRGVQHTQLEP